MKKSILFLLPVLLLANSCFAQDEESVTTVAVDALKEFNVESLGSVALVASVPVVLSWYAYRSHQRPKSDYCDLTSIAPSGRFYHLITASKALSDQGDSYDNIFRRIASCDDSFSGLSNDDKSAYLRKWFKKEMTSLEKIRRRYLSSTNKVFATRDTSIAEETVNAVLAANNLKDNFGNRNYALSHLLANARDSFIN